MTFDELVEVFRKWLLMPDDTVLRLILATLVAHHLPGDPVWLLILAPSGSGKTELLRTLGRLPFIYPISRMTPKTLWSGHESGKSSLIHKLENKVIVIKEMGTLLSMTRHVAGEVMSQLREVYDGYLTSTYGTGEQVVWSGRVGLIAAGVEHIERELQLGSQLGERFVYYRPIESDRLELARRALRHAGREVTMREELSTAVSAWWTSTAPKVGMPSAGNQIIESVSRLATWVTAVRSAPPRDEQRLIEVSVSPEHAGRLPKALFALAAGLAIVRGSRRLTREDYATVRRVAIHSAPGGKVQVIRSLVEARRPMPTAILAESIRVSEPTVTRWAEDLWHVRVLDRRGRGVRGDPHLYGISTGTMGLLNGTEPGDWPGDPEGSPMPT